MRSIAPQCLTPGMVVATSVYGPDSPLPLIASGVAITPALRQRLIDKKVRALLVEDRFSSGIEPEQVLADEVRQEAASAVGEAFEAVEKQALLATAETGPEEAPLDVSEIVPTLQPQHVAKTSAAMRDVMYALMQRRGLLTGLSDLDRFGGDRLQRAVNVCVIGMVVGRRYLELWGWRDYRGNMRRDQFDDRIHKLGIGLMLADIGMSRLPEELWDADPAELSEQDRRLVHGHPAHGVEILREAFDNASSLTSVAIGQHHERADGSGYPRALTNEQLHDHGLIAAVADHYVMLTGAGVADPEHAMPPHAAYREILAGKGTRFEDKVVASFLETVAPYSPGATVKLSDGSHAIVTAQTPSPLYPAVRITHRPDGTPLEEFQELELSSALAIVEVAPGLPGDGLLTTV